MGWQGLEIGIRAMAAAGAEVVGNGGCGPDDLLFLEGNAEKDQPKLEKFLQRIKDAGGLESSSLCWFRCMASAV